MTALSLQRHTQLREISKALLQKGARIIVLVWASSPPSSQRHEEVTMNTGKVKLYKKDEGYGVVTPDDGSRDVVFREIRCFGVELLAVGRRVSYKIEINKQGGSR
jgi:cold shock protein